MESSKLNNKYFFEPYGVMTQNQNVRSNIDLIGRARVRESAEQLRRYMPTNSYLEFTENGIKYVKVSQRKSIPVNNAFLRTIDGPTIPFELTGTSKNIEEHFLDLEGKCLKAIFKGRISTFFKNLIRL